MERRFLEAKACRAKVTRQEDGPSQIVGLAAVFFDGSEDTQFRLFDDMVERILPGTFDKALRENQDVRGLFNHDSNQVLGRTESRTMQLSVTSDGLRFEIEAPDTQAARDVVTMLERGDVTGSSFGFMVTDQEFRTEDGIDIREIKGVDLIDVGPVTFPAYEATTSATRSGDADDCIAALKEYREKRQERLKGYADRAASLVGG